MKTVSLFILALSVALLLHGTAFCSPPRHPGVAFVGNDSQERPGAIQPTNKQPIHQAILESIRPANPLSQSIQVLSQNAKKWKWELDPLSRPKFNFIPAADIGKYHYTDRYLEIGDPEVSHYFILQEDYVFRNLNGRFDKIPAGFIWDGASIGKKLGAVALKVGNTRYNSAIAEGLIHDYMYRNPQRYTKDESDVLFFINLRRCNNPNRLAMYEGVYFGGFAYLQHMDKQRQGHYDVFTPEFYARNLKTFQRWNESTLEKKAEATQQHGDRHSLNLDDSTKKEERKICTCALPGEFFAGVCKKKVGVIKNRLWAQYYCRNCGGFRRGSMFELRQTDKGVSVYPAGSVPSDWDGKIYEQSELDAHVRELRNSVKPERENVVEEKVNTDVNQQPRTNDSQVGIRGWCKCQKKNIDDGLAQVGPWFYDSFGREKYDELEIECDLAYFICCKCGRVVHPNDRTLRNQDLPIFDVKLYKMILAQDKNIVWRKAAVPLKKRQDQIAAIPDGQIVVHGKCVCKKENAHLVHVGPPKDGDFHVCIICGHVRSPDAIAGIPCEEGNE